MGAPQKRQLLSGEIPPLGAGYFVLGNKVPKAPLKNPWFLGIFLSPLVFRSISRRPARAPFLTQEKGRKVRLEPTVLRTPFSPLDCLLLSPARGHRGDRQSCPGRYALLRRNTKVFHPHQQRLLRWGGADCQCADRTPRFTQSPQEPLAKRKGRVQSGSPYSAPPGLSSTGQSVPLVMPNNLHPVHGVLRGSAPKQRFGSFAAAGKGTRSAERNIPVPKGHKSFPTVGPSRLAGTVRAHQPGPFLESGSPHSPPAALRHFPRRRQAAKKDLPIRAGLRSVHSVDDIEDQRQNDKHSAHPLGGPGQLRV